MSTAGKGEIMSTSLYNLTANMLQLMEAEETTNEQIEEVFGLITAKDNRIAFLRADIKGDIAKFKAEEERLAKIRKAMENKVTRLEEYIKQSMIALGVDEIKAETFKFKLSPTAGTLEIDDEESIPAQFKVADEADLSPVADEADL